MGTHTAGGIKTRSMATRAMVGLAVALTVVVGFEGAVGATSPVRAVNDKPASAVVATPNAIVSSALGYVAAADPSAPTTAVNPVVSWRVSPLRQLALAAEWRYADELEAVVAPVAPAAPVTPAAPAAKTATKTAAKPAMKTAATSSSVVLRANQFAFPALGIRAQGIASFACNAPGSLGTSIYRWGCAGSNNTYLLGHAFAAFKPINTGYHSGALKVGLTAYMAGSDGVTHQYRVTEIRHVLMDDWSSWGGWAKSSLPQPGLTLQTCDGPTSAYRIVVRLTIV